MRKNIIIPKNTEDTISIEDVTSNMLIFAERGGVLCGMVIEENKGWILKIGPSSGSYGHSKTLEECIRRGMVNFKYDFFVVD